MNQNTFILLLLPVRNGVNGDGAGSARAHAGRAHSAGTRTGDATQKELGETLGEVSGTGALRATTRAVARVRHAAGKDRHQTGHRDGFPRPDVRVTRSIKRTTATNAVCMKKQSMDRAAAFERFFLA
jgi:hypothetical protein